MNDATADGGTAGGRFRAALGAVLCLILVVFCYYCVDRPVARAMYAWFTPWRLEFTAFAAIGNLPLPAAVLVLASAWIGRLGGWRPGPLWRTLILAAVATLCALAIKDGLKEAFGRAWPETWAFADGQHPSFIGTGTYGFFPFHGSGFAAFPSGHTTAITAPMVVFWRRLPRLRWLWGAAILLTVAGLIGADYHFVGDTIGGFFLGFAVALGTLAAIACR